MGRLAALYFGKRSLKDYKYTYHLTTALFFYALIGLFPTALAIIFAVQMFTILKLIIAIIPVVLATYSATTWRQTKD
jgi:ABC-type transport system involved in cytochrome bd biosynthesis fused ATPase/permease subunit